MEEKGTKICSDCLGAVISNIHYVIFKSKVSFEAILVNTSLNLYRIIFKKTCVVITSLKTVVDLLDQV